MRTVRGEDGSLTIDLDDPSSKDSSEVLTALIKATLPGGASLRLRDVETGRTYSQHTNGYTDAPDPTSRPAYDPDCPCEWRFMDKTKTCPFAYGYNEKTKRVVPAFVEHANVDFWIDFEAAGPIDNESEASREVMELLGEVEAYTREHPMNWRKVRVHFGRVSDESDDKRVSFEGEGFEFRAGLDDDHRGANHIALRSWTVVDEDVICTLPQGLYDQTRESGCRLLPEIEPRTVLFVSILKSVIMAKTKMFDQWYELFCKMSYNAGRLECSFNYGS